MSLVAVLHQQDYFHQLPLEQVTPFAYRDDIDAKIALGLKMRLEYVKGHMNRLEWVQGRGCSSCSRRRICRETAVTGARVVIGEAQNRVSALERRIIAHETVGKASDAAVGTEV